MYHITDREVKASVGRSPAGTGRGRGPGRTEMSNGHRDAGAGDGIRTRDFDLGKVALYH